MVLEQLPYTFMKGLKFWRDRCHRFPFIQLTSDCSRSPRLRICRQGQRSQLTDVATTPRISEQGSVLSGQVAPGSPSLQMPLVTQGSPFPPPAHFLSPLSSYRYGAAIGLGVALSSLGPGQAQAQSLVKPFALPPQSLVASSSAEMTTVSFQTLDIPLNPVGPPEHAVPAVSPPPGMSLGDDALENNERAAPSLSASKQPVVLAPTGEQVADRPPGDEVTLKGASISAELNELSADQGPFLQSPPQPLAQSDSTLQTITVAASSEAQNLLPLNPDPRELQVPTDLGKVTIDLNRPLTLEQALELAQRNNLTVQIAELQLQVSRAALRQARALNYPRLDLTGQLFRTENATFVVNRPTFAINPTLLEVQQRTLGLLQTEQAAAEFDLDLGLSNLQALLQTNQDTRQDVTFNQQIADLDRGAIEAGTLAPIATVTPLSPFPRSLRPLVPQSEGTVTSTTDTVGNFETTTAEGRLELAYRVFTSGFRSGTIGAAREQVRNAELQLQVVLEQLHLDVTNDYYDLQQADALVTVAQDSTDSARANLRNAQALEAAGLATLFDVLQAEVQLAQAIQDLTQGTSLRTIAQRQLAQRLNLAPTANVTAADPAAIAGLWPLSLEETILRALQYRPELEQFLAQRRIAQFNRRAALSAIRPQIEIFANVNAVDFVDDSVSGAFGYTVGVRVSWTFFDGGAARARAAQEEKNIAIAETQFANTKNQLRFEVEQAYSTLRANFGNIGTSLRSVEQAQENLRLAQLRFQAGIGTQLEISNAQANLTQSEGNLVDAVITYNRALAQLERSTSYRYQRERTSL